MWLLKMECSCRVFIVKLVRALFGGSSIWVYCNQCGGIVPPSVTAMIQHCLRHDEEEHQ